ncbi:MULTISPECIES: YbbR-like domain-containing protein [Peptoniphilus]|uniref:CdaR family protein n=1 Tax=Peptoniphilus TaxID=162289 RepID=UPI00031F739E|nr:MULTISPECIES: CdaR family protein [Peptoniphilus]
MKKAITQISKERMLQIISVVFAILLWSYVRSGVDPEMKVTYKGIEVRYENIAEIKSNNLSVISPKEATVDVVLKGKQSNISKISRESVRASVNLSGYYSGDYKIPIKVQVDANNIIVDSKEPESISFKIDENISKNINVDIKTVGELADNYVLGNVKQKEEVKITGPKTYIDSIDKIVAVADISGKSESTVITTPVIAYNKDAQEISELTVEPENLNIEVPILKTEIVPVRLRIIGKGSDNIDAKEFFVEPNSVTIKGNSAVINKIDEILTKPVNVNDLTEKKIPVDIDLPDGVALVDNDLKFVASHFPISLSEQNIDFKFSEIKILNLEEKLEEKLTLNFNKGDQITVVVTPKDPLSTEKIDKENMSLSLDLKDYTTGVHNVKLNVSLPEIYKVVKIKPEFIEITIDKKRIF